jgi:predicted GIY-YIG superfamily endonuclease
MSERTAVYRLYDDQDVLLYVGVAKTFGKRWTQHASAKSWWPEVQRQTVEWFPDRDAAFAAEGIAMRDERPRHNIQRGQSANGLASHGKTPNRPIRVESELWDAFGAVVGHRQRSGLIRDFIRWYLGRTDELPERPKARASAA